MNKTIAKRFNRPGFLSDWQIKGFKQHKAVVSENIKHKKGEVLVEIVAR